MSAVASRALASAAGGNTTPLLVGERLRPQQPLRCSLAPASRRLSELKSHRSPIGAVATAAAGAGAAPDEQTHAGRSSLAASAAAAPPPIFVAGLAANDNNNEPPIASTSGGSSIATNAQRHTQPPRYRGRLVAPTAAAATLAAAHQLLLPLAAHASEVIPAAALDLFAQLLDQIQALGPWGPLLFVVTVMTAEMVPLLPTQPLTLASGLLFGAKQGALLIVLGTTLAAFNAFVISRGIGRRLAERIVQSEGMGGSGAESGKMGGGGMMAERWAAVRAAIDSGGAWRQFTAIALLRLTPVVPFSASNYLLGLTPVQLPAYLGGTVAGMTLWALLYASLGGASRRLLDGGMELDVLIASLLERAGAYTTDVALVAGGIGALALIAWLAAGLLRRGDDGVGGAITPAVAEPALSASDGGCIGGGGGGGGGGAAQGAGAPGMELGEQLPQHHHPHAAAEEEEPQVLRNK